MSSKSKKWFEKPVRAVGVNMWAPEWYSKSITNFDADKLAEALKESGTQVALTFQGFSQDWFGVSFYDTKSGHIHKNLQVGRDHIKEYVEAAHKYGMQIFAYYSYMDKYIWDRTPEWRQVDETGEIINHHQLCPNSPYIEYALTGIREIAENYDIDGFLLDMFEFNRKPHGCYCQYCQRQYMQTFGKNIPKFGSYNKDWVEFINWRYNRMEDFYRRVHDTVKEANPDILLTHNSFALRNKYEWGGGIDFEKLYEYDDIVTNIADTHGSNDNDVMRFVDMIWMAGFYTRALRGMSGKPVWMQYGRFPYTRDYQFLAETELKLSNYSITAAGGSPFLIDNVYPEGDIDKEFYEVLKRVQMELADKRGLEFDEDIVDVGLFYSRKSNDMMDILFPKSNDVLYVKDFKGYYKVLVETHVPFGIVGEHKLSIEKLKRFKMIIAPNMSVMSDATVEIFREYVAQGGALILTGQSSLWKDNGIKRDDFGLSDVIGASYDKPFNYRKSFIKPLKNEVCSGVEPSHLVHRGFQTIVIPEQKAKTAAYILYPGTETTNSERRFTYSNDDIAPGETSKYPSILTNIYGNGKCIYFSGDFGTAYGVYGYVGFRKIIYNCIKTTIKDDFTIKTNAPMCVEVSGYKKGNSVIIHILNYAVSQLRIIPDAGGTVAEENLPCHDIRLKIKSNNKPTSVKLDSSRTQLDYEYKQGIITVMVDKVELYDLLILDF
jgi:hypothetical protein